MPLPALEVTVNIPSDGYDTYIKKEPEVYGVKWVYKSHRCTSGSTNKDIVFMSEPWSKYYQCHRAGTCRKRSRNDLENETKKRPVQKESKKIDCKAKLQVSFDTVDPNNVSIKYSGQHNHSIGSVEDMQHLTLSSALKELIGSQLSLGYDKRDVRVSLQKHFSRNNTSSHRDHFVHADEIYNIFLKIQQKKYKLKDNLFEPVEAWLESLSNEGYSAYKSSSFYTNYSFGFLSSWQKDILLKSSSFCLDATHNTTNIEKGILYTVVTTHPNTGTGCPVAFFFTTDHSSDPVIEFLSFLKDLGLTCPEKITIDVSHVELLAINAVYPDTSVQWCLFHVGRAWFGKIKEHIKGSSFHETKRLQNQVMRDLRRLVEQTDESSFGSALEVFFRVYAGYPEFLSYFQRKYINNGWYKHWVKAFQPQYYTNMETNNYVESWHNQLKTTYLKRNRNRRLDRLVYVLTQDVLPDYLRNIRRISYNIGRMGPMERERRKRMLLAEEIPEELVLEYVNCCEIEEGRMFFDFKVKSFTEEETYYDVPVDQEGTITSCQCQYFVYRRTACKHMFLVQRFMPVLIINQPTIDTDFNTVGSSR